MNALAKTPLQLARDQGKVGRIDSAIEATFAMQARAEGLPQWVRNHVFLPDRLLQIDFAWPALRFGIEVQGAVHRIGNHIHRDCEKQALALLAGWTILPVTGRHVRSGQAIAWARSLIWERRGLD
jgi:very-short-patch-repair endonuclease